MLNCFLKFNGDTYKIVQFDVANRHYAVLQHNQTLVDLISRMVLTDPMFLYCAGTELFYLPATGSQPLGRP